MVRRDSNVPATQMADSSSPSAMTASMRISVCRAGRAGAGAGAVVAPRGGSTGTDPSGGVTSHGWSVRFRSSVSAPAMV